jgi:hypothetical protein
MSTSMGALTQTVSRYLDKMGLNPEPSEDGLFWFKYGSTVVMVRLFEHEGHTFVRFLATLLSEVNFTPALVDRVLELNIEVLFGTFLVFKEDRTLAFAVTLLGDKLDFEEFESALSYVARVSDDYDDPLQELAGGKRAEDILREGGA